MPAHHHTHNRANMYGLARHARHYERWAGFFARPLYRRIVADVAAAALPADAVVLDVGTGPGTVPLLIAAQSPHLSVFGIDLSRRWLPGPPPLLISDRLLVPARSVSRSPT